LSWLGKVVFFSFAAETKLWSLCHSRARCCVQQIQPLPSDTSSCASHTEAAHACRPSHCRATRAVSNVTLATPRSKC